MGATVTSPRVSRRGAERFELTEAGRLALEYVRLIDTGRVRVPASRLDYPPGTEDGHACAWCGLEVEEGEVVVPAGDGRVLHDTPSCRAEYERWTA